ncbi:hypothetical protein COX69_01860, partial [Candidatus Falkowbacteria bacterium CG_4_10_14_0_2_um_filter_48_10]
RISRPDKSLMPDSAKTPTIGFIGQGWIGKNYADDFEKRGLTVVRYALEEPYVNNGGRLKNCDIVFVAVPTPSTPQGFDDFILRQAVKKAGAGKIVVIKSTIVPGTTVSIQDENPDKFILHSPEFLTESTAAYDAAHPMRNIIGLPRDDEIYRQKADAVLAVLPPAEYTLICLAPEAELIKYAGNCWFYFKVIYINLLYDLAQKLSCRWEVLRDALAADPRIGSSHLNPVHQSGEKGGEAAAAGIRPPLKFNELHLEPVHKGGRGAGGHCFIKDFAAFRGIFAMLVKDDLGLQVLEAVEKKNIQLLLDSHKDLDLLEGVYGEKS